MRNRLVEIMAAVIGVAAVVFFYLDRAEEADAPPPVPVVAPAQLSQETVPAVLAPAPVVNTGEPAPLTAEVEAAELEAPEVMAAQNAWELAREELDAVEAELEELDLAFDAKEAEFEELEAGGMDLAEIEDQMLVYLDSVIDRYDALETRLMEAEAAELEAAERLDATRRAYSASRDSMP